MSIIVFQLIGSKNTNAIGMKGRNVCNFFIFFNFAMWLTYTFERQSANSSAIEFEVLGPIVWAIIQRMTLPMIIFFHFHALLFCVELKKQYPGTETAKLAFSPSMVAIVLWRLIHPMANPTENQDPGASKVTVHVNGEPIQLDEDSGTSSLKPIQETAAPTPPVVTATESTTATAEAKPNEATAIKPKDDERDAIIAALKSRQIDRIVPYLPDGDEPQMIKILDLEAQYDIHHDPPSSSDDDSEEYIPPY